LKTNAKTQRGIVDECLDFFLSGKNPELVSNGRCKITNSLVEIRWVKNFWIFSKRVKIHNLFLFYKLLHWKGITTKAKTQRGMVEKFLEKMVAAKSQNSFVEFR
jgi:hypothetical protein